MKQADLNRLKEVRGWFWRIDHKLIETYCSVADRLPEYIRAGDTSDEFLLLEGVIKDFKDDVNSLEIHLDKCIKLMEEQLIKK